MSCFNFNSYYWSYEETTEIVTLPLERFADDNGCFFDSRLKSGFHEMLLRSFSNLSTNRICKTLLVTAVGGVRWINDQHNIADTDRICFLGVTHLLRSQAAVTAWIYSSGVDLDPVGTIEVVESSDMKMGVQLLIEQMDKFLQFYWK